MGEKSLAGYFIAQTVSKVKKSATFKNVTDFNISYKFTRYTVGEFRIISSFLKSLFFKLNLYCKDRHVICRE